MKRLLVTAAALALAACSSMPSWVPGTGWTTLIDGDKGLDNFERVGDANWRAEGGAVVADKGKGGFLVSKQSYKDFDLRVEFWADDTTNSGIFMRCQDRKTISDKSCYEANIFDQRPDQTYATGGIVHFAKVLKPTKAGGKWNTYEINAKGSKVTVTLNGTKTAELDHSQFAQGPIALQFGAIPPQGLPGGSIKWRKVQIRELK